MYTQTIYELSQEAERLLQLSRQQLQLLEKCLSLYPEKIHHH